MIAEIIKYHLPVIISQVISITIEMIVDIEVEVDQEIDITIEGMTEMEVIDIIEEVEVGVGVDQTTDIPIDDMMIEITGKVIIERMTIKVVTQTENRAKTIKNLYQMAMDL